MENKYWQSLEENQPGYMPQPEEKDASMMEILANAANDKTSSRRDFLKWCGISFFSATVISACEHPVKKAIPYLNQPETVTPGIASWYASSFVDGNHFCSVLVKSRDGRPIKIEGNDLCSFGGGGTSAIVQASVLSLYDDGARFKFPLKNNEKIKWENADQEITEVLRNAAQAGKKCYLVTPTLLSPSTTKLINEFKTAFPAVEVITWDAVSYDAIRTAHKETFGQAIIPDYNFHKAELVVSFSADFLGTWLSPVAFANRFAKTRRVSTDNPNMSRHIQFEAAMSVTGSNADERIPVKPSDEMQIIMELYNEMAAITGNQVYSSPSTGYDTRALALEILSRKGKALVVCGHNNPRLQAVVNAINLMAEAYGNTIDTLNPLHMGTATPDAMDSLIKECTSGNVAAVIVYNNNPAYSYHAGEQFAKAMASVPVVIGMGVANNETFALCNYILPDNHYLESWGDASPKTGFYTLLQPVMQPIFNTRQFQATLLAWMGKKPDFHSYLKEQWKSTLFPAQNKYSDLDQFWINTVQAGIFETNQSAAFATTINPASIATAMAAIKSQVANAQPLQFITFQNVAMTDGSFANNPWLQELPDPVSKITWDNFAAISPRFASENNLNDGDIISLNGLTIPVAIQPGQAYGCFAVALGYGHEKTGKTANNVGSNAYRLLTNDSFVWNVKSWEKTGSGYSFARTQTHHNMEGRHIVRESTLDKYRENPKAGNEIRDYHKKHLSTLYPPHEYQGHHWALMIDLNACTGCSTCVIACQAENNTPVIGKAEVMRKRIMHWMRIDRYYEGDQENPSVLYMPLMCQHCDNAPCENVCPVAATNHSHEGINQMAYNRCVGTKYCINNCPYKVRRFNWFKYAMNNKFDYNMNSELGRMVLNPDVTVRERGVVEKCSFCMQRIQEGKLKAKTEGRKLKDGDIVTACMGACPSNAIVFGDINDPDSRVAKLIKDQRNYHLLEEMHTLPSVGYLTRIRNSKA